MTDFSVISCARGPGRLVLDGAGLRLFTAATGPLGEPVNMVPEWVRILKTTEPENPLQNPQHIITINFDKAAMLAVAPSDQALQELSEFFFGPQFTIRETDRQVLRVEQARAARATARLAATMLLREVVGA